MQQMEVSDYVNESPRPKQKGSGDANQTERRLCQVLLLSFGLLCVIQAILNVSLRLTFSDVEADFKTLTEERDDLKRKLNNLGQGEWEYFNGSFYYISSIEKTWQESRDDCLQKGADLVIINSKEEQDFTRKFEKIMWIGLTDSETEGTWKWVDGTPLTKSYWDSEEPNGGERENCGHTYLYNLENSWNDTPCDLSYSWICEMKVRP
ncbi:C-type lectin domain family 4 member F-like [Sander lucioperca]|uniref:C-type lectin domain family 4 member F-like n=1 Tax=Sander lucioperca TaxID=283035 RepID=UPI00125E4F13|nr:C-type lectin domain family 4 member F-like [Sander lucioperca]